MLDRYNLPLGTNLQKFTKEFPPEWMLNPPTRNLHAYVGDHTHTPLIFRNKICIILAHFDICSGIVVWTLTHCAVYPLYITIFLVVENIWNHRRASLSPDNLGALLFLNAGDELMWSDANDKWQWKFRCTYFYPII